MNASDAEISESEFVEFEGIQPGWSVGRVVLALVVLASFGVWVYAYSGLADRRAPDTFDDNTFVARAEAICAATQIELEALPNALEAADEHERADQIRVSTQVYRDMVDRLALEITGSERDVGIIELWLERWRIILNDRDAYADRLDVDPNAFFYLSSDAGRRAERSLTYVADTNGMYSCGAPEDVG